MAAVFYPYFRRLFVWKPHKGAALSFLSFLDDHINTSASQFWKYAVTGANNNTEIKLWSCEKWDCLQTISSVSPFSFYSNPLLVSVWALL